MNFSSSSRISRNFSLDNFLTYLKCLLKFRIDIRPGPVSAQNLRVSLQIWQSLVIAIFPMTPMTVNEWQCCMPLAFLAALNWCNANAYLPFVLFFFYLLRTGATRDVSIKTQCVNNEWWSPCAHFSMMKEAIIWQKQKQKPLLNALLPLVEFQFSSLGYFWFNSSSNETQNASESQMFFTLPNDNAI
jgi:hypothetical protein